MTPLITRLVLWVSVAAAGVLAALAEPLIKELFGAEFTAAAQALLILLPGVVCLSAARILANDLAARGLVHINLWLALVVLAVNIAANLVLIPPFGIAGAAAATTLAYASNFLIRLALQQRLTRGTLVAQYRPPASGPRTVG